MRYVIVREIPFLGAYIITIMNQVVPNFITLLLNFEAHETENSYQASHYLKICLFRWVNTVLILSFITPFTNTLAEGPKVLVPTVFSLYFSEITMIPVLNYFDISGTLNRHLFGPRERNQRKMNLKFQGSEFYLADVYTVRLHLLHLR